MKVRATSLSDSDHWSPTKPPSFVKVKLTALSLLFLSFFVLLRYFSLNPITGLPSSFSILDTINTSTALATQSQQLVSLPAAAAAPPRPPQGDFSKWIGIIDENGVMAGEFIVGDFESSLVETVASENEGGADKEEDREFFVKGKFGKFEVCDDNMSDYIPCLDNAEEAISNLSSPEIGAKYERHCPENRKRLDCVVPRPKGYKFRVHWPESLDEVWVSNIPQTSLVDNKEGQNLISRNNESTFIFPGGGTQFPNGVEQHLDQISKMVPDIAFGERTRVVLDIGCGIGSFGAYLSKHNVTTLSIAPKDDASDNQIQFALERGVSAMVAGLATRRLLMLRAGGYFVLAEQYVDEQEKLEEQWKEMEDLAGRLCWELVKKESNIAIWRKPLNNSCYFNRDPTAKPSLCGTDDDPDDVWYVNLKACISPLPENGYGANISTWPARLNSPPDRLLSIEMDSMLSRKEIYKADNKYMHDIISGYVGAFHWKDMNLRNVMDMKAGYGGFAAALVNFEIDCWVMNVVPVSGSNTLPVIYDRGLIGVMHDWCEPFDTYPRTYDFLNAIRLFSVEKNRCNISNIVLEMDRILRPGGRVYIRDLIPVIDELEEIIRAVGWVTFRYDDGEGPYANSKLLTCEKRL
nr:probable methyltransferase PMT10 [Ipomoea batatas]